MPGVWLIRATASSDQIVDQPVLLLPARPMDGMQLAAIVDTLLSVPSTSSVTWELFCAGEVHWRADWGGGVLELRTLEPEWDEDQRIAGRRVCIWWQSPVRDESVRITLGFAHDRRGSSRLVRHYRLIANPSWIYWGQVQVSGGRWIGGGPPGTEGYWAPADPLVEYCHRDIYDSDLDHLPPEVCFLQLEDSRVTGRAAGVRSMMVSGWGRGWDVETPLGCPQGAVEHLPDLCQYRRRDETWYRHPDDSWQLVPPDGELPVLWIHSLSEMAYLHRAARVLCPIAWLPTALLEQGGYRIRGGRSHCLLTRRSSAKSARSAVCG